MEQEKKCEMKLLSMASFPSTSDVVDNGVTGYAYATEDGKLHFFAEFESQGICRSRPLFLAAVEAAAYAIWSDAYMHLFGEEGILYINEELMRVWSDRAKGEM